MNIFDNIAKNVRKAQVPAVESLTESEIDGLTFAATTNEDYDTLGTAMEAMGVKTAYKEEKVDNDDLTEAEIRQLYDAGMEDEDPDDYEDPYTEETIIDGYIDEAYAEEADEALGELTEEDLEDIEDDEGMESYLSAADFEPAEDDDEVIAEESIRQLLADIESVDTFVENHPEYQEKILDAQKKYKKMAKKIKRDKEVKKLKAEVTRWIDTIKSDISKLSKDKAEASTESFEETGSEEDIAIESKLQRDRVKNAKQRKAFIDQQLKTLNTAIKIKQREIKAYSKEHKKDSNYADRLEKLTTDMNDIIAKQTQYSKELAALNEVINMKGYTESEQARILQAKDAKIQRKLNHQELEYQAKLARQEDMYRREQDRLDKQTEMNFKRDMTSDARNFMMQDHNADRQYNVEMNRLRTELEESRRNSAALAAETNKTIAELQALIEEQKKQALAQQEELLAATNAKQNEMLASVQTKNPFLKKFNQKVMDNFTNIMKAMSENQQAMNVAVASFCYGVNEEDVAEESALELVSAFIPTDEMECP